MGMVCIGVLSVGGRGTEVGLIHVFIETVKFNPLQNIDRDRTRNEVGVLPNNETRAVCGGSIVVYITLLGVKKSVVPLNVEGVVARRQFVFGSGCLDDSCQQLRRLQ